MDRIVGIALVVNSSRGPYFVFNYPSSVELSAQDAFLEKGSTARSYERGEDPESKESNDKEGETLLEPLVQEGEGVHGQASALLETAPTSLTPPPLQKHQLNGFPLKGATYLGLPLPVLANILSPKSALWNGQLSLAVDQWLLLCHPVSLNTDSSLSHGDMEHLRYGGGNDMHRDAEDQTESRRFPGNTSIEKDVTASSSGKLSMSMLNLVLILRRMAPMPRTTPQRHKDEEEWLLNGLLRPLTKAYQLEQAYVRQEVEQILKWKENQPNINQKDLMSYMLDKSRLCQELQHIYCQLLSGKGFIRISINNRLELSLRCPWTNNGRWSLLKEEDIHPMPFHSLLLLQDTPDDILDMEDTQGLMSDRLLQFLTTLHPRKTLQDSQRKLDWTWLEVRQMSIHLVYWRKAKLILPLTLDRLIGVSDEFSMSTLNNLLLDKTSPFLQEHILSLIAAFKGVPKTFGQLLPLAQRTEELKSHYTLLICHLLRLNILQQYSSYYICTLPLAQSPSLTVMEKNDSERQGEQLTLIKAKLLTYIEMMQIERLVKEQLTSHAPLFLRCLSYWDGRTCLDEVAFRERISRKELMSLIEMSRSFLTPFVLPVKLSE